MPASSKGGETHASHEIVAIGELPEAKRSWLKLMVCSSAGKTAVQQIREKGEICCAVYAEKELEGGERRGRRDLKKRARRICVGGATSRHTHISSNE